MRKYVKMQIIKHALEYYIQRPGATQEELKNEKEALKQVVQEVENLKLAYKIENKVYIVKHESGITFTIEASSPRGALKKSFQQYRGLKRRANYEVFKQNINIEEYKEVEDINNQ